MAPITTVLERCGAVFEALFAVARVVEVTSAGDRENAICDNPVTPLNCMLPPLLRLCYAALKGSSLLSACMHQATVVGFKQTKKVYWQNGKGSPMTSKAGHFSVSWHCDGGAYLLSVAFEKITFPYT